ncbi:S8/S53 family peptidase [Burkholderia sp. FERM BP-3421]|uniref:S8/S53 family peptidase n=1 Tax=Burkholderia sp. FERM BP-3421 TaxID=1494466 RepID=UPI0023626C0D|nr:S8/S53 family peptidase [Burkholderia sp. FERM BP-3421]WDD91299.1 S8/S53 family peptidase [Burkholderia sp. FERM BP-3421]
MPDTNETKLLIRLPRSYTQTLRQTPTLQTQILAGLGAGAVEPLFTHASARLSASLTDWLVFQPDQVEDRHPWDRAHRQAASIARGAAALDVYVEPNSAHRRNFVRTAPDAPTLDAAPTTAPPFPPSAPLNSAYPPAADTAFSPGWHLSRAGFPRAWAVTRGGGVRIAHLDIGWWPGQYSAPRCMRPDLGYNFVEDNQDTVDPDDGPNAGHGTATLALLAGNKVSLDGKTEATPHGQVYEGFIGGAPEAEIVPVRIAGVLGSVVYLYGNTMARGLDYALDPGDGRRCDVISLSQGGLPLKSWAYAVNALYEAGVVVVAAAGDSYWAVVTDIATHYTVYPAAFYRVVTATGVTYDDGPYKRDQLGVMQGCWGPDAVMAKAVGAYTPNVPWMRIETQYGWGLDGGGTSASTPQIAAACALWLARYGSRFPDDWRRVAACRAALGRSVADARKNFGEIGLGRLDACAMMSEALAAEIKTLCDENKLQHIDPDEVSFPFLRLLFGLPPPGKGIEGQGVEEMYEVEALQIFYRSTDPDLVKAVEDYDRGRPPAAGDLPGLRARFLQAVDMSDALRGYLTAHA